jgi:hypothetical protein
MRTVRAASSPVSESSLFLDQSNDDGNIVSFARAAASTKSVRAVPRACVVTTSVPASSLVACTINRGTDCPEDGAVTKKPFTLRAKPTLSR